MQRNDLKIFENSFELSLQFKVNNIVNFPNFLRINLEKSFYLKQQNACITDTNLPSIIN